MPFRFKKGMVVGIFAPRNMPITKIVQHSFIYTVLKSYLLDYEHSIFILYWFT